jgi:penicillin amidase
MQTLGAAALLALAGCAAVSSGDAHKIAIKRDTYGVPHIYANDARGLFYGYGYVVAEDRLYQKEMARRAVLVQCA